MFFNELQCICLESHFTVCKRREGKVTNNDKTNVIGNCSCRTFRDCRIMENYGLKKDVS